MNTEGLTAGRVRGLCAELDNLARSPRFAAAHRVLLEHVIAALKELSPREDEPPEEHTCTYCFKRPGVAVDDDLDAICSECSEPRKDANLDAGLQAAVVTALDDALLCTRVWEAWSYGTMREDDFTQAAGDPEFVAQIVNAVRSFLASRTVETAEEWEYGIDWADDAYPVRVGEPRAQTEKALAEMHARGDKDARLIRRRMALPWEPVPPAPEEPATARECGNDSHHGYNTGYCGDCAKEALDAP